MLRTLVHLNKQVYQTIQGPVEKKNRVGNLKEKRLLR